MTEKIVGYIFRGERAPRGGQPVPCGPTPLQPFFGVVVRRALSEDGIPGRGSYPRALLALGIREYREAFFKPYRVIYRTAGPKVYVYLIVDGRRDMQALLLRRLIDA